MTQTPVAIVALTRRGAELAQRVRGLVPSVVIHAPQGIACDQPFAKATERVAALFAAGEAIIGICAAGILIRAVAPLLADKTAEPPVIAIAEDGSAIVPLLGGHRGANALARRLADALGQRAAVTTASDVTIGVALDEPPPGWRLGNAAAIRPAAAALLTGATADIVVEAGNADWLAPLPRESGGAVKILVTDRAVAEPEGALVYHPPVLALGVGCERGTDPQELIDLVMATLAASGLAPAAVGGVFSIDLKADEVAVHDLARHLGVEARFFAAARLAEEKPRLVNPSEIVFRATGCWGVAEGAALAAVGANGALIVPKQRSTRATVAIAKANTPISAGALGRPQGRLAIVGIGPGNAEWRSPEATHLLARARHLVGYGLYIDLLGDLAHGKTLHETGLGHETERARRALDLAASGEDVALISSGDAGIYALATLVFELITLENRPEWRRIDLSVAPGISALQAAAARAGAPLGHDFCAISLSDLLTPWATIRRRLEAAAEADFVVALYNPRSERRTHQLAEARDILARHRPGTTPVILARNLGRPTEAVTIVDLADFDIDAVDMLTLVMIGNSQTSRVPGTRWVYTPRGYAGKEATK
jgi:cobalt-precorrin 5A hydrolase/precorrin-3B C17-methyltransferase